MRIQLIAQDDPACIGIRLDQSRYVFNKVCFGPGMSDCWSDEFASGQMDVPRQDGCPMPDVVKLSAFHFACLGRQGFPIPLKSLYAGFFVDADHMNPFDFVLFLGCGMQFADLFYLLCKLIPVLNVGMFPVSTSMRLECGILLKNARSGQEKSS